MIFLTSELANKAEIAILSARDTTRAWVPGRGIMGRNVWVYKKGYNSPSAESRKFGFMAHLRGTAETCLILIFAY